MDKNYDKEVAKLEVKMETLEKRLDKNEEKINNELFEIRKKVENSSLITNNKLDNLDKKLDDINSEADFSKGFLKALLFVGGILAFVIPLSIKLIGN